mmetsp:Transcript_16289/g.29207  ORF Transcript_16289/g.29207 Transcript_16289/m.29207 type:complete len:466 (-) Transcript_16289:1396-2793(-)
MSLPWRFTSADRYVDGTIERLEEAPPSYKHLNLGKYYLQQTGDDLTQSHLDKILKAALSNQILNELTFCGVSIEKGGPAFDRLCQLLLTRTWKRITFASCTGEGLSALSSLVSGSALQVPVLSTIRIKNCVLELSDVLALQTNMSLNPELKHLEISEVNLSVSAREANLMPPLARGVASSKSLEVLELSYCTLDVESIHCLSTDGLKENQSLVSLFLPGCELEDDAVATLVMEGLSNHSTLKNLKLFRNHCGEAGAAALTKLLEPNNKSVILETLDLSYQQFERANKLNVELLATSLGRNRTLKHLTLSFNKLNDSDAEALAEGLKENKSLTEIDLRANNIRDKGASALAEGVVSQSPTLEKFCMYGNPLGDNGAAALLAAIRQNSRIQVMNMDYNLSVYDEIQYYAYLNQVGRRLLEVDDLNPALWTVIIQRAQRTSLETRGVCTAADLIFPFVRDPSVFNGLR